MCVVEMCKVDRFRVGNSMGGKTRDYGKYTGKVDQSREFGEFLNDAKGFSS